MLFVAFCLAKTYSRGGLIATAIGLSYLIVHNWVFIRKARKVNAKLQIVSGIFLLLLLVVLVVGSGVWRRSVETVTETDRSVGNRVVLWRYGLEMAADNPCGVGAGKSGDAYMQWYQPLNMKERYRTLVNSYLTFLVEHGWGVFAILFVGVALFWGWTTPAGIGAHAFEAVVSLRASLLAFGITGLFSTVMEEPLLWILPALCAVTLTGFSLVARARMTNRRVLVTVLVAIGLLSGIWFAGYILTTQDSLRRHFLSMPNRTMLPCRLEPRRANAKTTDWLVLPDERIMGAQYGRLLRQLALDAGVVVRVEASFPPTDARIENVMLVGAKVATGGLRVRSRLVLVEPAIMKHEDAVALLKSAAQVHIFLPEIDEDGRAEFWESIVKEAKLSRLVQLERLPGVGLRADWAWKNVIAKIRAGEKETLP